MADDTVSAQSLPVSGLYTPSLSEILANSAPPPWTLSSFMAHLSQNHCLENLEFTLDASWYKKHYFKMMNRISGEPANPPSDERAYVLMLWRRLIALYVQPNGAREINLPSDTRDALVDLSASEILPYPSVLDSAVTTVHKLMEESILPSFLAAGFQWQEDRYQSIEKDKIFRNIGFQNPGGSWPVNSNLARSSGSSYATARSSFSRYSTSRSSYGSAHEGQLTRQIPKSSWHNTLTTRQFTVPEKDEKFWSERGQHAEYRADEGDQVPLQHEAWLGVGSAASVDRVRCKRICLARKTMRTNRRLTKEFIIEEVGHLQRLQHSHIVQLIGTYVMGKTVAILLYPATEFNLDTFIESIFDENDEDANVKQIDESRLAKLCALPRFFVCLATALEYIHEQLTKHMDIKPQNILVRDIRRSTLPSAKDDFKIYIADFGIAKSYRSALDAETDTPTACTIKYSAPEVVEQETRGLSADIFSLGCVYIEMFAAITSDIATDQREKLRTLRESSESGSTSYQANLPAVNQWLRELDLGSENRMFRKETIRMLLPEPALRPSASDLASAFSFLRDSATFSCTCDTGPDPLESAPEGTTG